MSPARVVALRRRAAQAPRSIATWALDAELAAYVEDQLHLHWPATPVWHAAQPPAPDDTRAELWICGRRPAAQPPAPTLWLGAVERRFALVHVGAQLWRCSTPFVGGELRRIIEQVWRQGR